MKVERAGAAEPAQAAPEVEKGASQDAAPRSEGPSSEATAQAADGAKARSESAAEPESMVRPSEGEAQSNGGAERVRVVATDTESSTSPSVAHSESKVVAESDTASQGDGAGTVTVEERQLADAPSGIATSESRVVVETDTAAQGDGTAAGTVTERQVTQTPPGIESSESSVVAESDTANRQPVSFGSRGAQVVALQQKLNASGAALETDGIFGPLTDAAVREYQTAKGLEVDGIVGPQTWGSIDGAPREATADGAPTTDAVQGAYLVAAERAAERPTLRAGASGAAVEELQAQLNADAAAGLTVDGRFGPLTEAAVRGYQGTRALGVDGIVGPKTWGALDADAPQVQAPTTPAAPVPGSAAEKNVSTAGLNPPALEALAVANSDRYGLHLVSGYREQGSVSTSDHPHGNAIDVSNGMLTPQMRAYADDIRRAPNVTYVIYDNQIATPQDDWAWRPYSHPGGSNPTLNHEDHVHVSVAT